MPAHYEYLNSKGAKTKMKNCIATLLLALAFLACGLAGAQQPPALVSKSPIPLTNVDGRIDHFSVDV